MEAKDLLSLVFGRWEFFLKLWDVYKLLAFALLAFIASSPFVRQSTPILVLVGLVFIGSAVSHLVGLLVVRRQWAALAKAAKTKLVGDPVLAPVGEVLEAPSRNAIIGFHLLGDAAFLIALAVIRWASSPQ
jgi:hypothetical protein